MIVPSYTVHIYQTKLFSVSYIYAIPLNTVPTLKSILYKKTFPDYVLRDPQILPEIIHCMKTVKTISNGVPDIYDQTIIKGYTYAFLGMIIKHTGLIDIPENKIASKAQDILLYLQEHYLETISLESVADYFGLD